VHKVLVFSWLFTHLPSKIQMPSSHSLSIQEAQASRSDTTPKPELYLKLTDEDVKAQLFLYQGE
jgi:hypothetical protein